VFCDKAQAPGKRNGGGNKIAALKSRIDSESGTAPRHVAASMQQPAALALGRGAGDVELSRHADFDLDGDIFR